MSRGFCNSGTTPFLCSGGGDPGGPGGMDCLQLRQSAGPFHYLISEQAKSLVALQELQHEVGALLEFRDLVIETFPNLRTKLQTSSSPNTMMAASAASAAAIASGSGVSGGGVSPGSNIPVAVRKEWEPGIRSRRKLGLKDEPRSGSAKKSDVTVQDSGFSTEASSKETHSASSSAPPPGNPDEAEDELWNLLDVIHRKGTRLKEELDALQGSIRSDDSEIDFQRALVHSSADDVRHLRRERDLLLDRVAEMEAEVLAGRVHTSRLQEDLEHLLVAKTELEEQLKAVKTQSGAVNTRIHDLHSQFVARSPTGTVSPVGGYESSVRNVASSDNSCGDVTAVTSAGSSKGSSQRCGSSGTGRSKKASRHVLDTVLGDKVPKSKTVDSRKLAAILKEHDPIVLQRHLLTSTVQNQILQQQLDTAARLELSLVDKLDKAREENEELKFQLEDKNIELEGTRARVRMFEQLQRPIPTTSPDVIPSTDSMAVSSVIAPDREDRLSRTEITTASMKAMSPIPMNHLDHSSSTESAHDQAHHESGATPVTRKSSSVGGEVQTHRRKPSKIPLVKSYAAPKPPGGKHSPAPGARSRSGDRPPSAQSLRAKMTTSESASSTSLSKSRNSLSNARDSLTGKVRTSGDSLSGRRSSDSFSKLRESPVNSSLRGGSGSVAKRDLSFRKPGTPVRRNSSIREGSTPATDAKTSSNPCDEKYRSLWAPSSYNDSPSSEQFLDSLDLDENVNSTALTTLENSSSHRFQTANTFLWKVGGGPDSGQGLFYDSINTDTLSSLYKQNGGEEMAEFDSLEKKLFPEHQQ
ncbi:uncharacterized protein LOC108733435 isoform X2 [Agrilus planipennis]|uniref:Uncharacterized protein LOC108733435 isoform X2 n=1 Tax=Agrilus planipennis TaxID=224129 RepID=A0A1W4WJB2_AGRPL|nr:uncharacterized protein LOC108733435 isoform X2 [Agrilus planipennis]